jgi:pimeloyl-ACP methyl ester carboxylesterase
VALWGSSLGGAHVIHVAADDERVAAVVAQVPFNGFPRKVEGRSKKDNAALLWAALKDRARAWLGRAPAYVPVVARPGERAVIVTDQADTIVAALEESHWENRVAPRVILEMALWYRPSRVAHRVTMPLLVCLAERDEHTPPHLGRQIAEHAPRCEVRSYPCTHFDFYDEAVRQKVVQDQSRFLQRALS